MILSNQQLQQLPVFGVVGNFAEHLSQAGEDADFLNIKIAEADAPKGIFPIYLPKHNSFLGVYPLSHTKIIADFSASINLHMEAEMCVLFDLTFKGLQISTLKPTAFTAFNDCSIRKPNAQKISEKKNWGENGTGIAQQWIELDSFSKGSMLDHFHIVSYLKRDGQIMQYGMDSPVSNYQYFYEKLLAWINLTLNHQIDMGPLEHLNTYLNNIGQPQQIIISLGATRYTEFGETGFLKPNDDIAVFVYDDRRCSEMDTLNFFRAEKTANTFKSGAALFQKVSVSEGGLCINGA